MSEEDPLELIVNDRKLHKKLIDIVEGGMAGHADQHRLPHLV